MKNNINLLKIFLITLGFTITPSAFSYDRTYGNDNTSISLRDLNKRDYNINNIYQNNGNNQTLNIPSPQGQISTDIFGQTNTFNLNNLSTQKQEAKRKRYYSIQKRKKANRLAREREEERIAAQRQIEFNKREEQRKLALKLDEEKKIQLQQKKKEQYKRNNPTQHFTPTPSIPSSAPQGIPHY